MGWVEKIKNNNSWVEVVFLLNKIKIMDKTLLKEKIKKIEEAFNKFEEAEKKIIEQSNILNTNFKQINNGKLRLQGEFKVLNDLLEEKPKEEKSEEQKKK